MNITLIVTIGLLLLFICWLQWRHERWVARVVARLPAPERPTMYADLFPEEPFELRARVELWEVAPTRVLRPSIHPPFQSYGVDISVAPTIGVC